MVDFDGVSPYLFPLCNRTFAIQLTSRGVWRWNLRGPEFEQNSESVVTVRPSEVEKEIVQPRDENLGLCRALGVVFRPVVETRNLLVFQLSYLGEKNES